MTLKKRVEEAIEYYKRNSVPDYVYETQDKPTDLALSHDLYPEDLVKLCKKVAGRKAMINHEIYLVLKKLLED